MSFNFDTTAGISQNSLKPTLAVNEIHEVTFKGCEAKDVQNKSDASLTYKLLEVKFENEHGVFVHTVWEPKTEDGKDREGQYGPQPSNVKAMMLLFKHLIDAVNPKLGKQIDAKEKSIGAANWDDLRTLICKATAPGIGTVTKIKLIRNNKGEAIFPYFAAYSRAGDLYMQTNFIGDQVYFTNKELEKIKKVAAAKPTTMTDLPETPEVEAVADLNFDL